MHTQNIFDPKENIERGKTTQKRESIYALLILESIKREY